MSATKEEMLAFLEKLDRLIAENGFIRPHMMVIWSDKEKECYVEIARIISRADDVDRLVEAAIHVVEHWHSGQALSKTMAKLEGVLALFKEIK